MTILIGEMEPNLTVDLANAIDNNVIVVTQILSSYIYYKYRIKNKKCKIFLLNRHVRSKIDLEDKCAREIFDKTVYFYKSLFKNHGFKDTDPSEEIRSIWGELLNILNRFPISSAVIWNVSSATNAYIDVYCKNNNIKRNILENGFNRPFTITLDYYGMNIESGYLKLDSEISRNDLYKTKNGVKTVNPREYMFFRIFDMLLPCGINRPFFSFRIKIKKIYRNILFKNKEKPNKNIHYEYDFLPLQLLDDSQNLFYSPYSSYKEVIEAALTVSSSEKLLVKIHPLDINRELCVEQIQPLLACGKVIISENNTSELIRGAQRIICVNSTVGFEALTLGKEVYLLGSAMYENVHGIINRKTNRTFQEFLNRTQVEFPINDYNENDIKNLVSYIQ